MLRPNLVLPLILLALALGGCKKDDRGDDTDGQGGAPVDGDGDGDAVGTACDHDKDCDDELFCNGEELCISGFCRRGERVNCDDNIECTGDRCVESSKSCAFELPDQDHDGSFDQECEDEDGNSGDDCDDDDSDAFPGNSEVCDAEHRDEDCDPTTLGFRDADNDGYRDAQCCNQQADGDLLCEEDCDDHKANVNPESPEVCDFLDNDCNGDIDEGVAIAMYPDKDHDGHGDDAVDDVETCPGAVGFALVANDCDDEDPEVFLGQFEICDDKDNNCDGQADEVEEYAPWFADVDQDGYGDPDSSPVLSCYRVAGRVLSQNDCNDRSNKVNPNATELCDAQDNDCNGLADYRLAGVNNFEDDDKDGIADADCDGGTDCNDTDPRTGDGLEEVCDHVDNDCDGEVDEQTVQNIWYVDDDGDGWGVVLGSALASCDPLPGRATQFGDCDDSKNEVHPDTTELCDGIDQDCDGVIDEGAAVHCKRENAITTCSHGDCQIFSCIPGFVDQDGNADNGCETPVDLSSIPPGLPCALNSECDDGNICNGVEVCHELACRTGTPLNCDLAGQVIQGNVVIATGLDIKALEGIELITGDLVIENTGLSSLVGLESLKTIGGTLSVRNNNSLKKLSGSALSNLEVVGGDIIISGNPALISADLPSLISANALEIRENNALKEIKDAYLNLAAISNRLTIVYNPQLNLISGFDSLTRIGGEFPCARSCGTCSGVGLTIYSNDFVELKAFQSLLQAGDICIGETGGEAITLPKLSAVGMSFWIGASSAAEIDLPKLKTVAQAVSISTQGQGSSPLTKINFPALTAVGGEFTIQHDGPDLRSIEAPKLTTTGSFTIRLTGVVEFATLDLSKLVQTNGSVTLDLFELGPFDVVSFPKLASAQSVYFRSTDPQSPNSAPGGPRLIRFDALTSTSVIEVLTSGAIEGISFASLQSADVIDIEPAESQSTLTALGYIDLDQLKTVNDQLYINTPIPSVSVNSGLRASVLSVVGSQNDGYLTLCTGANVDSNGNYDNAACEVVDTLITGGFIGTYDTCAQCFANR